MAAHRPIWTKVVKSGTLVESHVKRPWCKFECKSAEGDAIVNS